MSDGKLGSLNMELFGDDSPTMTLSSEAIGASIKPEIHYVDGNKVRNDAYALTKTTSDGIAIYVPTFQPLMERLNEKTRGVYKPIQQAVHKNLFDHELLVEAYRQPETPEKEALYEKERI